MNNPKDFQPAFELKFQGNWPTAVAFLGDSGRLAAGDLDGRLLVWQLPEKTEGNADHSLLPVRRLDGHTNGITRFVTADDGATLISASLDHSVRLWNADAPASGSAEVVVDIRDREQEAKKTRSDAPLNAPGVTVETQTAAHVFDEHKDWVQGLGISRDGKRLVTGDDAGLSIVWDLAARKEVARWTGYPRDWVLSAALSPDGKTAFTAEYCARRGDFDRPPPQAHFWNADDGTEKLDLLKVQFPNVKERDNSYGYSTVWGKFVAGGFVCADFSPDGKLLAVGQGGETDTGKVHLIEVETGKLVRSVAGHQYGVTDAKFSADGKYTLSTGRDTTLQICSVEDGKEVARLGTPRGGQFKDWLSALAISPDEKRIAATDISGLIHVWQIAS